MFLRRRYIMCIPEIVSFAPSIHKLNQEPRCRAWHSMVSTATRPPEAAEGSSPLPAHSSSPLSAGRLSRILQSEIIRESKYWRICATCMVESIGKEQGCRRAAGGVNCTVWSAVLSEIVA